MPTKQKKADVKSLKRKLADEAKSGPQRGAIDVVIDHELDVPFCEHGPCLLFEQFSSKVGVPPERYFACSVYRSKHKCSFKWPADKPVDVEKIKCKKDILKLKRGKLNRQQLKERLKSVCELTPEERSYCINCQLLLLASDKAQHLSHNVVDMVSDHLLTRPTRLITALEAKEQEAQYWFSKDALKLLATIPPIVSADAVLCIGTPRLFEHLASFSKSTTTKYFLLDYDFRFAQFFNVFQYGQYNMFTHYFHSDLEKKAYLTFLSKASNLIVFVDPPFGGLVEPISRSLDQIKQDWINSHKEKIPKNEISEITETSYHICWIFPYYMEKRIHNSNIRLQMSDFKVNYDNHPLYQPKTGKSQSPIRLFTDIPLKLLKLPEEHGYKHCPKCDKYVSNDNKHCKTCNACTSKDGRNYRHCAKCARCVKGTYSHCRRCKSCHLPGSACVVPAGCSLCGDLTHRRKQCSNKIEPSSPEETDDQPRLKILKT